MINDGCCRARALVACSEYQPTLIPDGQVALEEGVANMSSGLDCPICFEQSEEWYSGPCGHVVCESCKNDQASSSQNRMITCSFCRNRCPIDGFHRVFLPTSSQDAVPSRHAPVEDTNAAFSASHSNITFHTMSPNGDTAVDGLNLSIMINQIQEIYSEIASTRTELSEQILQTIVEECDRWRSTDNRISTSEEMMRGLQPQMVGLQSRTTEMAQSAHQLLNKVVALETTVSRLNPTQVNPLPQWLNEIRPFMTSTHRSVKTLRGQVDQLQANYIDATQRISAIQNSINRLEYANKTHSLPKFPDRTNQLSLLQQRMSRFEADFNESTRKFAALETSLLRLQAGTSTTSYGSTSLPLHHTNDVHKGTQDQSSVLVVINFILIILFCWKFFF